MQTSRSFVIASLRYQQVLPTPRENTIKITPVAHDLKIELAGRLLDKIDAQAFIYVDDFVAVHANDMCVWNGRPAILAVIVIAGPRLEHFAHFLAESQHFVHCSGLMVGELCLSRS